MEKISIIGIDGGASKVSAWEIVFNTESKTFGLGKHHAEFKYSSVPGYIDGFEPVNVASQLAEREHDNIVPSKDEQQQEAVYVEACAQAIEQIGAQIGSENLLIGIGMPGLKTSDQRGIAVVANGPRMLHYSTLLEERLRAAQIKLASPIAHLGSDADYCGLGENYAGNGAFKPLTNAYYLGGGTGVADALKLNNKLVALDQTKTWLAKTWEMQYRDGRSLERFCSASGLQSVYAGLSNITIEELNSNGTYPPQIADLAGAGNVAAIQTYEIVSDALALLLYERITSLYAGWAGLLGFMNPNRPAPQKDHPYLGQFFDQIIIGQRLGDLMETKSGKTFLLRPLLSKLQKHITESSHLDNPARDHYADVTRLIRTSVLREAPALGAGVDAFLAWQE